MMMKQLQRYATLWLLCLLAGFAKAQDVTATWDFNAEATITQLTADSESTESDTIRSNGIALVVLPNGNKIEKAEKGIKTDDGVTFKVEVKSNLDMVTVKGGKDFAYTVGDKAATKADTTFTATDADVKNGFVTIVNNGGSLFSISVVQKEKPKPVDPPALDSLIVNGVKYAATAVFGDKFEAEMEIGFNDPIVSTQNPIKAIPKTGTVESITYTGDSSMCSVVIKMKNGDKTVEYKLNVKQKPSVKLTYIDSDGETVIGEARREKGKTIDHFDIADQAVTVEEGNKMRGWYRQPEGYVRYLLTDNVNDDIKLYAFTSPIEEASTSAVYNFDLTDRYFDPANHEAFNLYGEGVYWYDEDHGWAFRNDNRIDLLVGPKATISMKLCKHNDKDSIIVITEAGDTLTTLLTNVEDDGDVVNYSYEGEGGTLSLLFKTGTEVKMHALRIINTAEANYVNQGNWYIVNPGDTESLLDVIDLANALNASKNAERLYIFLPNGTYDLGNTVGTTISGYNISLVGLSPDSVVVVTTPDNDVEGLGTADLLTNTSTGLYLQDITLQNALDYYGSGSEGAAAVLNDQGNRTVGKNVRMLSYESTFYSMNNKMQAYFEDCDIHGTTDFICGGGDIRFFHSTLSLEPRQFNGGGSRWIVAPRTLSNFGYVFDHCKVIDIAEGNGNWSFGRTWSNKPIAVYLSTTLDEYAEISLIPTRWTEEGRTATDPETFGEYNTMDANGTDITPETNTIRIKSSFQTILNASMAAAFDYDKMFSANAEKKWDPAKLTAQVDAPADAAYDKVSGTVTWSAVDGAVVYALFQDGALVTMTEDTSYNIEVNPDRYRLSIRCANKQGGFGPEGHVAGTTAIQTARRTMTDNVIYNLQGVRVTKPGKGIYIINGKKTVVR